MGNKGVMSLTSSIVRDEAVSSNLADAGKNATYETFLLHNISRVESIEKTLRTLCWVLPGRFPDSDLASEGLFTALNLLGVYHDSIVHKSLEQLPKEQRPQPSAHTRYTRHWFNTIPTYATSARTLTVLTYTSLFIEMLARKRLGKQARWRVVISLEAIKAMLRLHLFSATQYRPAIDPPAPMREADPELLSEINEKSTTLTWTAARTGNTYPSLQSLRHNSNSSTPLTSPFESEVANSFLAIRGVSVQDVKLAPEQILPLASWTERANEIAWILRPLLYLIAVRRNGSKSYAPFTLSLVLDLMAIKTSRSRDAGNSDLERGERTRRLFALWRYILRGPIWENITKPRLNAIGGGLETKSVFSFAGTILQDYVKLYDRYWYYANAA